MMYLSFFCFRDGGRDRPPDHPAAVDLDPSLHRGRENGDWDTGSSIFLRFHDWPTFLVFPRDRDATDRRTIRLSSIPASSPIEVARTAIRTWNRAEHRA